MQLVTVLREFRGSAHLIAILDSYQTAEETRATGINWAFAPCVTVPQDPRWGRTYEGYSEDPGIVRDLAGPD